MSVLSTFCADTANIWQVIGIVLLVFKIVIPLLIIVFGMLDLGKAVVSSDEKEISKAVKSLGMRAVAGIIIFFIPTLIGVIFGLITGFTKEAQDDYKVCASCISDPNGTNCKPCATAVWNGQSTTGCFGAPASAD